MNVPAETEYLRIGQVAELLHCSEKQIRILVKNGRLPQPIRLSPRIHLWRRADIDDALSSRESELEMTPEMGEELGRACEADLDPSPALVELMSMPRVIKRVE